MKAEISPDVVARELEGEQVILNLATGIYFGLDKMGSEIWTHFQESKDFSQVVDALVDDYDVAREECERDVLDFAKKLEKKGLVSLAG